MALVCFTGSNLSSLLHLPVSCIRALASVESDGLMLPDAGDWHTLRLLEASALRQRVRLTCDDSSDDSHRGGEATVGDADNADKSSAEQTRLKV